MDHLIERHSFLKKKLHLLILASPLTNVFCKKQLIWNEVILLIEGQCNSEDVYSGNINIFEATFLSIDWFIFHKNLNFSLWIWLTCRSLYRDNVYKAHISSNSIKQSFIYKILSWKYYIFVHTLFGITSLQI